MPPPHPDAPITPTTIMLAPELAVLEILDEVITIAIYALCAAHPRLGDPDPVTPDPPDAQAAEQLIDCLHSSLLANTRYRRVTLKESPSYDDDDIPF